MKKMTLLFGTALICGMAMAQNVGIGTIAPPLVRLHVSSVSDSNILLLENRNPLGLQQLTSMYFKTGSSYTGAIKTTGTSGVDARLGLFTYSNTSIDGLKERLSIADNGNVGIGTTAPTAVLDVNGSLRLRSGNPGLGKVLTSDANGNATWQTTAGAGFRAELTSPVSINSNYYTLVNFDEDYDDNGAFNTVTGVYTAPTAGVYHFTANVAWTGVPVGVTISYITRIVVEYANGGFDFIAQTGLPLTGISGYGNQQIITGDYKLSAGDKVHVEVAHSHTSNITLNSNGSTATRFMGYRVY